MKKIITIIALSLFFSSCSSTIRQPTNETVGKEGFLDANSFQVLIKSEPEAKARGLVEKRESAFKKGNKTLISKTVIRMIELCSQQNPEINKIDVNNRKKIKTEFNAIATRGNTVAVYYLEDNSALFIYRIDVKGLRKEIDRVINDFKKEKNRF